MLLISIHSIFFSHQTNQVDVYVFFLVFPSLLFLQLYAPNVNAPLVRSLNINLRCWLKGYSSCWVPLLRWKFLNKFMPCIIFITLPKQLENSKFSTCSWSIMNCIITRFTNLTFWRRNYFFLILAHPVYKMWIIQVPNKLELWNKLHFEEKKPESIHHV